MKTVRLENVGPVAKLSIPLPEAGVVVLRGRNGIGKSHVLAAIDSLISGRGRPPLKKKTSHGSVEGLGARLTIGRSTRRAGEVEVLALEGRLDISQLVQPPIKDEAAADQLRIKSLIQLSGQTADPQLFRELVPPNLEFSELVSLAEQAGDPIVLAGQLKRSLEAEARRWERMAEEASAEIAVLQNSIQPLEEFTQWSRVKEQPEVVRAEAEGRVAEALADLRELKARQSLATEQAEQIAQASRSLSEIEQAPVEQLEGEIADLSAKIQKLEQALVLARERKEQLERRRREAQKLQEQIAELRRIVEQPIASVNAAEIEDAEKKLIAAKEQLALTLQAIQQTQIISRIEHNRRRLTEAEKNAADFRERAKGTDEVLSRLVERVTRRLRVEDGRLVCEVDGDTKTFCELSLGERWRIALEIALEQLGRGGLVVVPQEAWESLDPVNRAEIANITKQVGVIILTAEADREEEITVSAL